MDRDTYRPCLFRDGAINGLSNPPRCISAELEAAPRVKLTNRSQKSHVAFLDQVKERDTTSQVTFGNADNQAQIRADERLIGFHRASLSRFHLLLQVFIWRKIAIQSPLIRQALILVEVIQQPV